MFGRNASAGLINIVSKRPNMRESEGYAEATYGNYDFIRLSGGVSGPIGGNTLGYRLDGVYVERDGFYKNVTQGGGSEARVNDRDRYFLRGQLMYAPTDALNVRLIADYSKRDESCCGAVYVATKETFDPTANPASATGGVNPDGRGGVLAHQPHRRHPQFALLPRQFARRAAAGAARPLCARSPDHARPHVPQRTEDYGISGQIDLDVGPGTLTSITAYRQYKAGGAADIDYGFADITYRDDDGRSFRRFKTFTQELRFQGSAFGDRLDYLVGGYYSNEKLLLSDNAKFGTQYGAFAACRAVATINPNPALRAPGAAGCLSAGGRATLAGQLPGTAPAFGPATPLILGGIDRLSTLNNLGDVEALYRQNSENYAFFTHNIFNITDKLSLTLGARYTNETKDFRANFNNNNTVCPAQQAALGPLLANPALGALAGGIITLTCTGNSSAQLNGLNLRDSRKEDEFTGTAVLSFKPTPQLLTYASYSKGYKAGGFNLDRSDLGGPNGVFGPRTNADASGLQFEAEKVDAYEIGAKFTRRNFNLNVAIFRQVFESFQLNTFNGSVFIVQNLQACKTDLNFADRDNSRATGACTGGTKPGVRSQGIEIEAAFYPTRDLQIMAGHTYSDAKFRKNLVGSSSGEALDPALFLLSGSQLSNAPETVQTGSITWTPELTSGGIKGLAYVDVRHSDGYNTGSDLFPEKFQEAFTLVNARVGIRGPNNLWALELWGQNIFNKKYQQVAFNTPFQGAGSVAQTQAFGTTANQIFSSFLAEPRTYGITARTRF
jgi:outer membrane receptor protein involved in Fe transport